jgi:hypothetical protein
MEYDVEIRFLALLTNNTWIEGLKATITSGDQTTVPRMPLDRQLFLSRVYLPELTINVFSEFGDANYFSNVASTLAKKVPKQFRLVTGDGPVASLVITMK